MKRLLLIALLPAVVLGSAEPHVDAARMLAHGISTGDQIIVGNALAELRSLSCKGDPQASELLGEKYFSGREEFAADPNKAELFLTHAAKHGVKGSAITLVMHYLKSPPTAQTLREAAIWLRVARIEEEADSPRYRLAESGMKVASAGNPNLLPVEDEVAREAALILHAIRNDLLAGEPGPCQT
ncbi:hypothetical protein [Pseudomonas sp. GOM6]|uniref:hypothetical protein n=1 Tax=Pseudomonas sp. GOM6 TaxID=3036944 RepID=UPI00240A571C|nr:hypothetical protein [Pseudomonas sp. GOM6]MDG1580835.1 hypothetical protein [Pseudomonas sp. GOM6]